METKDKFYLKIIDQQIADAKKTRNFMEVARLERSRQVIKQYNQQELDALLEEYFPDEIEKIVHENDVEYNDHVDDYEEQFLAKKNSADDAIQDDAEEILLGNDSNFELKLGNKK